MAKWFQSRIGGWVTALLFVLLCYALLRGLSSWIFDVSIQQRAITKDLAIHLLLGGLLYAASRSLRWYLPTTGLLLAAFHLSNAAKVAILGTPMMPDDFLAVRNLFMLLQGWQLMGIILIVAIPFSLLAFMLAWRSLRAWVVIGSVTILALTVTLIPTDVVKAMDRGIGNSVWNQRGNYEARGLPLHLLQETARYLARAGSPPSQQAVTQALAQLNTADPATPLLKTSGLQPRNVHLILLESFWDPMALKAAGIASDPVDPRFRELWRATDYSQALSPVFGGYTANAEFEVLCGFPVTEDAVFFEGWLRRDVPCLPRRLVKSGYRTLASHPNVAGFWNRVNAYRRIGFDTYWSDKDFIKDDMNRNFLSDSSLYRQVMSKIQPMYQAKTPIFNYILTYFGHLEYPLNEQRPNKVEVTQGNRLTGPYVNTIYYKSRELMDFLAELRKVDPEALIVLFGDHLPFLGPNFAGFTESGLLADNRSKFDEAMVRRMVSTPLVIIDGKRGPIPVGNLPMYRFPGLILELLGDHEPSLVRLLDRKSDPIIRPLPGMHLVSKGDEHHLCRQDQPATEGLCADSHSWLKAAITLTHDLFGGKQYGLAGLQPNPAGNEKLLVGAAVKEEPASADN